MVMYLIGLVFLKSKTNIFNFRLGLIHNLFNTIFSITILSSFSKIQCNQLEDTLEKFHFGVLNYFDVNDCASQRIGE